MTHLGLFIGIDRYASSSVSWLASATKDAKALYALFADNLGGEAKLLLDQDATSEAIKSELEALTKCAADDVVVLAFSGHGTPLHHLVTYDADLADLDASCISLDDLTEWFRRIPASRLICILDCCFSGGAGAKVLQLESRSRRLESESFIIDRLSGEGRLILTASRANEEAWENSRLGHGLLTYYLLEALRGVEEVRAEGRVSLYRLLQFVAERVMDASSQLGKEQQPTLRGQIEGDFSWPVFRPGAVYASYFPEIVRLLATADVSSLAALGLPQEVLDAWSDSIPTLNQLQIDAINEFGVLETNDLVVVAPTSSGKTVIGELAAMKSAADRRRAFFLLPLRALVNDKFEEFQRRYGSIGIRTIRATGEIADDIPALMRGQYDICLMTYEKFTNLALTHAHILEQVGVVVVDEVQMLADESRGVNLEFLLTLLRVLQRRGVQPQLIALSGVIGDTNGLEHWLNARLLRRDERPIPLDEGILHADGSYQFMDPDQTEQHASRYIIPEPAETENRRVLFPLIRRLVNEGKQVLIFRATRPEARATAVYLSNGLLLPQATRALESLPDGDPSDVSRLLRQVLSNGVALHMSDLDREERAVIEQSFRQRDISVLVATTTLAMGVNTPAEAVIIIGLEHPPDDRPYSVAEYKNMVGRAGRLGYSERGSSYLLGTSPHMANLYWANYVKAQPEDLSSRFFEDEHDPRSLVLRVLTAIEGSSREAPAASEVIAFIDDSFGAFLERRNGRDQPWSANALQGALQNLQHHGLVTVDPNDRLHSSELGRLCGEMGIEVESITRVVSALSQCTHREINDPALIATTQLTTELDQVRFPFNKKSKHKEPAAWISELGNQGIPRPILVAMQNNRNDPYARITRAKKAVACLLWITDRPLNEIERIVTRFGGSFGVAAGEIRAVAQRTVDMLPAVTRVVEILDPESDLGERRAKLMTRLQLGVPSEAYQLGLRLENRLSRADYLRLVAAGLVDVEKLKEADDASILNCLSNNKEKLVMIRKAFEDEPDESKVLPLALGPYRP